MNSNQNIQNLPKPPAGYRELREGETILGTDVVSREGECVARQDDRFYKHDVGRPYSPPYTAAGEPINGRYVNARTFRKLEPVWRRLEIGEVVREGDYFNSRVNPNTPEELSFDQPRTSAGWLPVLSSHKGHLIGEKLFEHLWGYRRIQSELPLQPAAQKPECPATKSAVPAVPAVPADAVPADAVPLVNPGSGYRFVQVGEALKETDFVIFCPGYGRQLGNGHGGNKVSEPCSNLSYQFGYYIRALTEDQSCVGPIIPVDPGAGYRLLNEDEFPGCEGDEVLLSDGNWEPYVDTDPKDTVAARRLALADPDVRMIWGNRAGQLQFRRKLVDAGEGYRLLQAGEEVQDGDEYHLDTLGAKWSDFGRFHRGCDAGIWLKNSPAYVWRRKVEAPKPAKVERPYTVPQGYRELNDGETVLATDYMLAKGVWVPRANTRRVGRAYEKGKAFVTIRWAGDYTKLAPGYRLLGPSEKIEEGDRYWAIGADRPPGGSLEGEVHTNLGKTWAGIDEKHPSWLGVVRRYISTPAKAEAPVTNDLARLILPFQGPVTRSNTQHLTHGRSVTVERNASGAARITITGLLGRRVFSMSREAADALADAIIATE